MTRFAPRAVAVAVVAVLAATLLAAGGGAAATGQFPVVSQVDAAENTSSGPATDENTSDRGVTDGNTSDGIGGDASAGDANATVEPGAMLAGVVGVQEAEVDSEVDNRTYGLRIASAATDAARAEIVAERLTEANQQLADQQRTIAELRAERRAGNISEGAYRAQVATIAAETANTERAADQLNRTASDLPAAVRERNGINASAIKRLRGEASELSGPETAAIARSIAGTNARNPMAGSPSARGPFGPQAAPGQSGERGGPGVGPRSDRRDGSGTEPPQAGQQRPGDQNEAGNSGQSAAQDGENSRSGANGSDSDAEPGSGGPEGQNTGNSGSTRNNGDSSENDESSAGPGGGSGGNTGSSGGNSGNGGGTGGGNAP